MMAAPLFLSELLSASEVENFAAAEHIVIHGLSADSREIQAGMLFAALAGSQNDGAQYAQQAINNGASAIICGQDAKISTCDIPVIRTPHPRKALAKMASAFYPGQPETIAAITGTSGKSSVAIFLAQLWQSAGLNAAALGTLGLYQEGEISQAGLTTPDPVILHQTLDALSRKHVDYLAMEASSHGLHQYRLDGVKLKVAGFNNLGRDHMDYHKDEQDYFLAKRRLFDLLPADGTAIAFDDDPWGQKIMHYAETGGRQTFAIGSAAHCRLQVKSLQPSATGQRLEISLEKSEFACVHLPLIGKFQADNALMAAAMAYVAGMEFSHILTGLEGLQPVPGRLEKVGTTHKGASIIVDYAHKPDALYHVLSCLKPLAKCLIIVFGAGGNRDQGKRPLMGKIAHQYADMVIVTDDNPRDEDPQRIRHEILAATPQALEIGDRREAIAKALSLGKAGDIIVIAGKGHESGQTIAGTTYPFSDKDVVHELLGAMK